MLRPSSEGICGGNKFRSVSWKNISVSLFLGKFGAGLVLCLASMSKENEGLRIEKRLKQVGGSHACKCLASICKDAVWPSPYLVPHLLESGPANFEQKEWMMILTEWRRILI